jgi:hypothetical protein
VNVDELSVDGAVVSEEKKENIKYTLRCEKRRYAILNNFDFFN